MKTATPELALREAKSPVAHLRLSGRGYRLKLLNLYFQLLFNCVCGVESVLGPFALIIFTETITRIDLLKRRRDFPQFVRLRNALGPDFWKGTTARRHYHRMVRDWTESGAVAVFYHRLGFPRWQKRFQVRGPLPQSHADWGKRPVIFTFLHTGPYGITTYWLRSQGIPAASLTGGLPLIIENEHYRRIQAEGDQCYGLEGAPHAFQGQIGLRESIRFLTPGQALVVALDGGRSGEERESCQVDGIPIFVKQGAVRLAAQTNSILIPISVKRTGFCRFEIHFRAPVPDELIRQRDPSEANQHLVSELWQEIKNDPSNLNWTTLEELAPALKAKRASWP